MSVSLSKSRSLVSTPSKRTVSQLLEQLANPKPVSRFSSEKPELDINVIKGQIKKNWRGTFAKMKTLVMQVHSLVSQ